jgi:hypothetical protein
MLTAPLASIHHFQTLGLRLRTIAPSGFLERHCRRSPSEPTNMDTDKRQEAPQGEQLAEERAAVSPGGSSAPPSQVRVTAPWECPSDQGIKLELDSPHCRCELRFGLWSDLEIKTLFQIVASVNLQRASSRSCGCEPTSPKWEMVTAELPTRFRERTAGATSDEYFRLKTDFAKNLPAAEYAVLAEKYSIQESLAWSDLEIKALFQIVASVNLQRTSSRSSGCEPTSPKWEVVAAELATRFRERRAVASHVQYKCLKADFAKNLPAAEYVALAEKYSMQESRGDAWSDLEIKALFQILASVNLQRASSRSSACAQTSPKWEVVAAELTTRFLERTARAARNKYILLKSDFAKNSPAAEYAVLAQKYSIRESLPWSDLEIKALFQIVAAVDVQRASSNIPKSNIPKWEVVTVELATRFRERRAVTVNVKYT